MSDELPLVSVIIPAYNVAPYIAECIDSVRSQSHPNFEAIVINDGSTDNTLEVINRSIAGDERFILLDQKNAGLSATRNRGISAATGEFIYFLDSDDRITHHFFEEAVTKMVSLELDLLTFNARSFMDNEFITSGFNADNYIRHLPEEEIEPILYFLQSEQFRSPVWLYFYRLDFINSNQLRFKEGILHEDESFSLIASVTAKNTAFVNNCYFERRVREDSIMTSKKTFQNTQSYFEVFKESAIWYDKYGHNYSSEYYTAVKKRIAMFYLWALRGAIDRGELREFRKLAFPHLSLVFRYTTVKNALAVLAPAPICKLLSA